MLATSSQFLTSLPTSTRFQPVDYMQSVSFTSGKLVAWALGMTTKRHGNSHRKLTYLHGRAAMSKAHHASSRAFFRERFSRIMGRNFTFGVIWAVLSDRDQVLEIRLKKYIEDVSSVSLAR